MNIQQYNPNFCANFNSSKLKFNRDDFFVRIRGYGKNNDWSDEVIKTADVAVNLFRKDTSPEMILKYIAIGIRKANMLCMDLSKRAQSGILRAFYREGWGAGKECELTTSYRNNRYSSYEKRLDAVAKKPLYSSYAMNYSRPHIEEGKKQIVHASCDYVNKTLDYIMILCKKLFPKYIKNDIKPENMKEFNDTVAEIRWQLAHSTPFVRGSDAISNTLMRVIYKSAGIKSYPLKKGVSLDLEAFCTNLEEYKAKFTDFFIKKPQIIE